MSQTEIPRIGLGTWQNTDSKKCVESVIHALESGYRHIDTAQFYGNEDFVGKGIKQSSVPRDEIFLGTKVWINSLSPEKVKESTEESLERLQLDYIDVLYVHWPAGEYEPRSTLTAFEELVEEGIVRNIGVSNFTPDLLDEALKHTEKEIIANQVEMHPWLQQEEMRKYLQNHNMKLVAYSPLARGAIMENETLREIADKHNVTPAQISLAWLLSYDVVHPIPKATSERHIKENYEVLDIQLDQADIDAIEGIETRKRLISPSFAPF
ncbi:MAG: aldo/keto reductase [Candidatus Thorarchaeota archaeon]|nr:aldo/keto reductase [Candidatus Thorarchaeota archaeon]